MQWACLLLPIVIGSGGPPLRAETANAPLSSRIKSAQPGLRLSISAVPPSIEANAAAPGTGLQIEASRDLRQWTNWNSPVVLSNSSVAFSLEEAEPQLFFRAHLMSSPARLSIPPEVALGKRLFEESRFAQFFAVHHAGDVNLPLKIGDPILDQSITLTDPLPGAFAGQTISCRACHFFDEQKNRGAGVRGFADFSIRTPIPDRADGRNHTVRNTPALINAAIGRGGPFFLHYDGEFTDGISLAKGTLTGRNFGWLPTEQGAAVAHIARVIREDNGVGFGDAGAPYASLLNGRRIPAPSEIPLSAEFQLDPARASDEEVVAAVARLISSYVASLKFRRSASGEYEASPYDVFLKKNGLPRQPEPGESDLNYSRRLRLLLTNLGSPLYVTEADGHFEKLAQSFTFGKKELDGLIMFLAESAPGSNVDEGKVGSCIVCHAAPHFTDFSFHNTGATQWEYDAIHGEGEFAKIIIPSLEERSTKPDDFLPATVNHPQAGGRFATAPSAGSRGVVDLGLWNIYANQDFASAQTGIEQLLTNRFGSGSSAASLAKTVALFKTPGLRGLSFSAPYLHTGQASSLEALVFFYRFTSDLARDRSVRNVDEAIAQIFLTKEDAPAVTAFLRALNEDIFEQ